MNDTDATVRQVKRGEDECDSDRLRREARRLSCSNGFCGAWDCYRCHGEAAVGYLTDKLNENRY
jgi:hypothetical protein